MSDGYKMTDIGEIPMDWDLVTLGDIGAFKNGINKSKEDFGHGYPFVNLMNVFGFNVVNAAELSLVNANNKELKDYELRKGDVLFIRSSVKPSGVGLTALINEDLKDTVYSGFLIRFRDNGSLSTDFKRHCFYESGFRTRLLNMSSVSANTNINQQALEKLFLPVPPTDEQQTIAEILSTVDDKIAVIDAQINQTIELKKGLMQRLLTKGIGHTQFKDSPLGEIPESWEITTSSEIAEITSSKRIHQADYLDSGIPFYRGKEITMKAKGESLADVVYISQELFDDLSTKFGAPKEGDILITAVGTIGTIYLVKKEDCFYFKDGNLMWLRKISPKVDKLFLTYFYSSYFFQGLIDNVSSGSSQKALTIVKFKDLPVALPSLPEQQKIASYFSIIDEKLKILQDKKDNYSELKCGLMQQLLTGKIRVNKSIHEYATA